MLGQRLKHTQKTEVRNSHKKGIIIFIIVALYSKENFCIQSKITHHRINLLYLRIFVNIYLFKQQRYFHSKQ